MKNILIIGNGFDLYHKLPTRYTDFLFLFKHWNEFYKNYLKLKAESPKSIQVRRFVVSVDEEGRLTEDSLKDYLKHFKYFNHARLEQLNTIFTDNPWIKYFKESNYERDGWIDFESEIENVLNKIELFFSEEVNNCLGKMLSKGVIPRSYKVIKSLMKYTKALPDITWRITNQDIQELFYGDTKKNLLKELKEALDSLINALDIYMEEFVERIKTKVHSEQIRKLRDVNVLSFNYTSIYKSVYIETKMGEHHQVHGSLKDKDLVLGVGDSKLNNLEYIYFLKYFQRIQKRTGASYREWIPQGPPSVGIGPWVYIMGHSLGRADKGILDEFFLNKQAISRITIFYHNQKAYEDLVIALIDLYGKEFVIEQTGNGHIEFVKLEDAVPI